MNIFSLHISSMNLILWGCVIWLPAFLYVILQNEIKFKKNISLGVTMPQEAREDAEVLAILASFKKQLAISCVLITLAAFPCIFISKIGTAMTVWMIWLLAACILPYIPYVLQHKKLKQLKADRGWRQAAPDTRTVDLSGIAYNDKWMSPIVFLIPLIVSLLPVLFDKEMAFIYLIDAAMILFCWVGYRYLYRNKAELVDDNMVLTEALTRMRRHNWGTLWLLAAWFVAILNFIMWLMGNNESMALFGVLLFSAVFVIGSLYIEMKTRKLQEQLTAQSGTDFYVDEDDYWIWGQFYYNPNDARLIINNRTGMNTTINLARRSGQVLAVLLVILLLALPFFGVWMDKLETTPIGISISTEAVVSTHTGVEYEVPLDSIVHVEYVAEKPKLKRTAGTGMESVQKGRFGTPWGSASICVDPRTLPYIYLETNEGKRYLFGASDAAETEAVYRQLITELSLEKAE